MLLHHQKHDGHECRRGAADLDAASAEKKDRRKKEQQKELQKELDKATEADVDRIIDSKDNEYVLSKPSE